MEQIETQLHNRKIKLLVDLRVMFPLENLNGKLNLCGIFLPNIEELSDTNNTEWFKGTKDAYPKNDKEEIACALGYLAHILCMISKLLKVII